MVINKSLVNAVEEMDKLEVEEPLIVPFVEAAGKMVAPVIESVCPLRAMIPAVCVKATQLKLFPNVSVCPELFNVKALNSLVVPSVV